MGKLSPSTALKADVKRGPRKKEQRQSQLGVMAPSEMTQGVLSQDTDLFCFWEVC